MQHHIQGRYSAHAKAPLVTSVWVLRWILVGLTGVLAVALIARDNLLIGSLLGAMAVARVIMLVQLRHRRAELRERFRQRGRLR